MASAPDRAAQRTAVGWPGAADHPERTWADAVEEEGAATAGGEQAKDESPC
jgi:hypothetical protein